MKILIDMNLTPEWVEYFAGHGVDSVHWSAVGSPKADDAVIMDYARQTGLIVFTHDLDFGDILAVTHAHGPSVLQARVEDPVPASIGEAVVAALTAHAADLARGALLTLEPHRFRVRVLPILPGIRF